MKINIVVLRFQNDHRAVLASISDDECIFLPTGISTRLDGREIIGRTSIDLEEQHAGVIRRVIKDDLKHEVVKALEALCEEVACAAVYKGESIGHNEALMER